MLNGSFQGIRENTVKLKWLYLQNILCVVWHKGKRGRHYVTELLCSRSNNNNNNNLNEDFPPHTRLDEGAHVVFKNENNKLKHFCPLG